MTPAALLLTLQERGIEFWTEGNRIRFRGPPGAIAETDRIALADNRDGLLSLLREQAAARVETLPLSSGQQSLWLLDQLAHGTPLNNLATAVRLDVPPDRAASTVAMQRLVDRHPMLRASVQVEESAVVQRVSGAGSAAVSVVEAAGLDESALRIAVEADQARIFDLEHGPLFRVTLFDRGDQGHVLLLVLDQIVGGGLSVLTLLGEFLARWTEARGGPAADLPSLRGHYADFIEMEAALLAGPEGERMWQHWRTSLADLPPLLRLPADRTRSEMPRFQGGTVPFTVPPAVVTALVALSRQNDATLFTTLLSSWSMFLARTTGAVDMVIGTPFSIRTNEDSYRVVGDFVNALPLRLQVRWSDRLSDAVVRHRPVVVDAMDAGPFPIQEIINRLGSDRTGGLPLFNAFINVQQLHIARDSAALARGLGDGMQLHGTQLHPFGMPQQLGQFDLALNVHWFGGTEMSGSLDYAADLFDAGTVEALGEEYVRFLSEMVTVPSATLLPRDERERLLTSFQGPAVSLPTEPFPAQFRASAARTPRALAVRCGVDSLDYETLWARSDALARHLRTRGCAAGTVVGVLLDRSVDLLVAMIAVQAAGGAMLPLDPGFPPARLAHMVADSGAAVLLSDRGRPDWVDGAAAVIDPRSVPADGAAGDLGDPDPAHTAYVLYTSGSTGTPSGVPVPHRALSNLLGSILTNPGLGDRDVFAAVTTISFDIALVELFAPLLVGATVEILPTSIARDGRALAEALLRCGATIMQATPATWRMLVEAEWRPTPGLRAMSGGEAMTADLATALLSRPIELWNLYGPTETTIYSTGGPVLDPAAIDVGPPIANTNVYVVDGWGDLVPIGVPGQVWIGGVGVADGYHERPERTAQRFRADPFTPGGRIYDTGDTGRWTQSGRLALIGRSDDQIKLRGFRIEPGEIEAALRTHPDVQHAVVVACPTNGDVRLVAFVVNEPGTAPTTSELRQHVRTTLPDYMIPALFVPLAALPLTPNGKVDRRNLPNPFEQGTSARTGRPPSPGMERQLADIWQEVLGVEHVSADDKFFEIGGHSLLALRVVSLLERQSGIRLRPTALFFNSLAQLAEAAAKDR